MIGGTRRLVNKWSGDSAPESCSTEASHLFPVAREVLGRLVWEFDAFVLHSWLVCFW